MAAQKHETAPESMAPVEKGAVRRRGLIAGAAALAAGLLATRMGNETVDAADGATVVIGPNTYTAATTTLTGATATVPGFRVVSQGAAVPDTTIDAVQGFATNPPAPPGTVNNSGVHGRNDALGGIGTTGVATNGTGVYGQSTSGTGVGAVSTSGYGVYGQSGSGTGVYGSTATGKYGVYGIAGSTQGAGGVVGVATVAGTIGFAGAAFAPATDAGYFTGNVSVFGNLGVSGSKFAVVKGADNKYRGMYAVESPECWFEDFGTGTLANGVAEVKLDPLFAQHIHTDDYHVFVTEHGGYSGLHTTTKSAGGFTITADVAGAALKGKKAADLNGTFSYRVVAKRNDIAGDRLPVWEMPQNTLTSAAQLPKSPALPKKK